MVVSKQFIFVLFFLMFFSPINAVPVPPGPTPGAKTCFDGDDQLIIGYYISRYEDIPGEPKSQADVASYCLIKKGTKVLGTKYDYCVDGSSVAEYYCPSVDSLECLRTTVKCSISLPGGTVTGVCQNGKCVFSATPTPTPFPEDSGVSWFYPALAVALLAAGALAVMHFPRKKQ